MSKQRWAIKSNAFNATVCIWGSLTQSVSQSVCLFLWGASWKCIKIFEVAFRHRDAYSDRAKWKGLLFKLHLYYKCRYKISFETLVVWYYYSVSYINHNSSH